MKVKILKPWPVGGYTHWKVGTLLEVDRDVAIPGIFAGYVEDVTGKVVRPQEPGEPPVEVKKRVTKIKEE